MPKVSTRSDFFQMKTSPEPPKKTLANTEETMHSRNSFFIGEISKWLKGVDCKSIRFSVRGFESLSHHHFKKPAIPHKYSDCGLFFVNFRKTRESYETDDFRH